MNEKIRLQPLIDMGNWDICGYEALFNRGLDDMYPSAESILKSVFPSCKNRSSFKIFINMTVDDAVNKDFGKSFLRRINKLGIDGSRIVLELNENTNPDMLKYTKQSLSLLRAHGVKIALDDFGTQYSTLEFLSEVPLDIVKIDKKFVQNAPYSRKSRSMLNFCVDVCHDIECKVVAEGIETEDHLECVLDAGVDIGQGFFFPAPSIGAHGKGTPFVMLDDFMVYVNSLGQHEHFGYNYMMPEIVSRNFHIQ
jgi:EAL domain-containing protein (putative c-di-GMP-specific phosphodiesterase class I)